NNSFPEFNDCFLMGTLKEKKIVAIKLNAAATAYVSQASYLANMFGRLRDICIGPNQEIYLATNGANAGNTDPDTHSLLVLRPASTVGIPSYDTDPSIKVYPTVAKDNIHISSEAGKRYSLAITNVCGKLCRMEEISTPDHSSDISTLANGMYFITVAGPGHTLSRLKFIVAK
ncbi:MAG TPA: T9SS type A sorting domain-containing protein, partial [Puia sp.]|nr:T9SS type A sorting domain-containing protein [Puia sp.]